MIYLPSNVTVFDHGTRVGERNAGDVTTLVTETIRAKIVVKEFENRYNAREDYNPLPVKRFSYYSEYRLPPGRRIGGLDPGPERLVVGEGGEVYYTGDHYGTFTQLQYWGNYTHTASDGMIQHKWVQWPVASQSLAAFF